MTKYGKQKAGERFTFLCGCSGVLPRLGLNNWFAGFNGKGFICRVARILSKSQYVAKKLKYQPIAVDTSHAAVRAMMLKPNCERCHQPLDWNDNFVPGQIPHLHHNHHTGEIYGFTHHRCNAKALEQEIDSLREELRHARE